ncbi:hypothetical protein COCNU_13G007680 [Cocos nucifera]|uniref:Uncharacterized protein n=1 Tax=Cocos nucifera TaxID=13894 RepID=A0A8K0NBQ9_COCNU|nr:hypothetical protein COCNU_13G007680 [Cocos nucifera]
MWDFATLDKDLLYAVMPQHDLYAHKRDLGPDELLNQGFSSILDATSFKLFTKHLGWLGKNKKSLEEALQFMKDYQKMMEEKAIDEKLAMGLKKQLQEKLNEVVEKNKALLDLQRKANEGEKLLELW